MKFLRWLEHFLQVFVEACMLVEALLNLLSYIHQAHCVIPQSGRKKRNVQQENTNHDYLESPCLEKEVIKIGGYYPKVLAYF